MSLTAPEVFGVEVLAAAGTLPALAADVAASHAAVHTRRAYAAAYRSFCAFLMKRHAEATLEVFTPRALTAYRDALVSSGAAPSTVASPTPGFRNGPCRQLWLLILMGEG